MTDIELKELVAGLAVSQAKTDEQLAKTDAQIAKTEALMAETTAQMKSTDETLKRMGIHLGGITDNIGMTTEEYFYNSLYDNPKLGKIKFDSISKNIHTKTKRLEDEYDIVMYNGDCIALIECKYKAHENDVRKLIDKKVGNFRILYQDFKDYSIYLGIASFSFYPELEIFAKENGVAILKQKGDVVEIEAENLKVY